MDHFSLGATRQQQQGHSNPGPSSQQQYRMSPVNFSGSNIKRHNTSSANIGISSSSGGGNSQPQHFPSVFGSPGLQHSIFGRSGNVGITSSNYLNVNHTPPNHFNFPLRSNGINGVGGVGMNNGGGRGGFSGNGGSGGGPNNGGSSRRVTNSATQSQQQGPSGNFNKQKSNNYHPPNANDQQPSSSSSQSQASTPQYRIFKRGDSINGISGPVGVITNGNGSCEGTTEGKREEDKQNFGESQNKENFTELVGDDSAEKKGTNLPNKTPVSQVGDIARFHGLEALYHLIAEKGPPHSPTFTVELHLGTVEKYVGQGSSIKRAQHSAAIEALEKTELSRPVPRTQQKRVYGTGTGGKRPNWALMQLKTLADDLKEPISIVQHPNVTTLMDPFRRPEPQPALVVSIHVGERIFTGEGTSCNAAKNMAAMIALKAMAQVKHELDLKRLVESATGAGDDNSLSMENKSPISVVHEMAMKRGLCVKFEVTKEEGPPHNKVFTVTCTLGTDEENAAEGTGPTKQAAKKAASELMISKLNEMSLPPPTLQLSSLKSLQRGLLRHKAPRKKSSTPVVKDLEKQTVSPISRLIQIAHIRKYKEPEFTLIATSTNTMSEDPQLLKSMSERERRNIRKKKPLFTMEVSVGPHSSRGTGPNKKAAKKAAAEAALIEMGYGPTENGNSGASDKSTGKREAKDGGKASKSKEKTAIVTARQIVPGVLVLNSEPKSSPGGSPSKNSAILAQEMMRVGSSSSCPTIQEGKEKLAYLAKLLNVSVSYSDFPKKNEFLSVASLGTNPPQVAHGCGATLEEAQNMAATQIMEELSDIGLDNVKT